MDIKQNKRGSINRKLSLSLVQNWSSSGKLRKTSFLHKLASKDLLRINYRSIDTEESLNNFGNQIDSVITILNRMYENNWDFHLEPEFNGQDKLDYYNLKVKILFPEINITNSDEKSHLIKDLIVTFRFKYSDNSESLQLCPCDIEGTRGFMTFEEWFIGYNHSHLPNYKPMNFDNPFNTSSFCTGSETEINNTLVELNINGFSEEQFELFLYTINTLVEWESIEGIPYNHIEYLGPINENTHKPTINPSIDNLKNLYNKLSNHILFNSALKYYFNNNRFRIKLDSNFDNYIKNYIKGIGDSNDIKNFIIRKVNNTYYGFTMPMTDINVRDVNSMFRNRYNELPFTMFQGKKIEFSISDYSGEIPTIENYKTHPKFLEYVAKQLEQQLYYKAVRKSTIERQHQSSNA